MSFFLTTAAASFRRGGGETEPEPEPIVYEAQTTAYMNAIGVPNDSTATIYGRTGAEVWELFNSCIMIAKNAGKLEDIYTWHPMFGTSASTLGINAIDVSTFTKTFYGSWSFSELGNQTNGSNTYATGGFVPASVMSLENSAFTIASNTNAAIGSSEYPLVMGCRGGNGGFVIFSLKRYTNQATGAIGNNTDSVYANVSTSEGVSTISRFSGVFKYTRNQSLLYQNNLSGGNLPNTELVYGAYRNITSVILYEKQRLLSECIHKGDDNTVSVVQQMIDTWEAGLNRKTW